MKRTYTLSFIILYFLFTSCSKDFLKRYDERIIGTWEITEVNRVGIGGNTANLPFRDGKFTFYENATLDYTSEGGVVYKGHWDIDKRICDDHTVYRLQISAADNTGQQTVSECYDDIWFPGTNHLKASISSGLRSYVTHFRR